MVRTITPDLAPRGSEISRISAPNSAKTSAGQQISYDAIVFAQFAIAFMQDALDGGLPPEATALSELLVREEFRPALQAWVDLDPLNNPDAPSTPFDLEEYRNANLEEGERLSQLAESNLNKGKQANQNSDDFILAVVFFASVLFFGGIAPKFRAIYVRTVVLLLASGGLGFAAWQIATLPYH